MRDLTDNEIIKELKERFKQNKSAHKEQKKLMDQLEKVNKKLIESEKVKTMFLSNIRNEINNPLSAILGLSAKLECKPGGERTIKHTANLIHKEAFLLDFQLKNIFTAAELEAGELQPNFGRVNVYALAKGILDSFDYLIDTKKLKVEFICESDLEFITDAGMMSSIIRNLVSNGIEFNKDKGKLTLELELEDKELKIRVIDTGVGMEKTDYTVVFDRFVQLDSGATKSHAGHGLGLTVTKAQTELIQGSIMVDCVLGKGCSFGVSIPMAAEDDMKTFSDSGNVFFFDDDDDDENDVEVF
ncbi:MAG: HAMP domain-containing sensor histidine kinase [Bacteroidota bacterium]